MAALSRGGISSRTCLFGPSTGGLISARIHTCWRRPPTFFSGSQCRWNARNKPALLPELLELSMRLALFVAAFTTVASAAAADNFFAFRASEAGACRYIAKMERENRARGIGLY